MDSDRTVPIPERSLSFLIAVAVRPIKTFVLRAISAMRLIARDKRVPRPLRWIAAIGLLPIPGPVDEAVLLLVAPIFAVFYREPMRDAWRQAA